MNLTNHEVAVCPCAITLFDSVPTPLRGLSTARHFRQDFYELDIRLTPNHHTLCFRTPRGILTEQLSTKPEPAPANAIARFTSANNRDLMTCTDNGLSYISTFTSEVLRGEPLARTISEFHDHAVIGGHLMNIWEAPASHGLTVVEIESLRHEVRILTVHILISQGYIVRSQTIFECR